MKKYTYILVFILSIGNISMYAQQLDTIATDVARFTIDKLGQIYLADTRGNVFKKQVQNDSVKYYNNTLLGAPDIISAESGINLYVYFQDFGRLQVLDNYVSLKENLNLYDLGYNTVSLITASSDGGVWMYDIANNDLIKLSKGLHQVYDSGDLRNIVGEFMEPLFLDESKGMVFLADQEHLLVFDRFANLVKKLPVEGFKNAVSIGQGYIILTESELYYIDDKTIIEKNNIVLPIAIEKIDKIDYSNNILYLLMGQKLLSLNADRLKVH